MKLYKIIGFNCIIITEFIPFYNKNKKITSKRLNERHEAGPR